MRKITEADSGKTHACRDTDRQNAGDAIRNLRRGMGLTQAKFAQKFSIPIGTVQHWEIGIRKPPEYVVKMIERILDYERTEDAGPKERR